MCSHFFPYLSKLMIKDILIKSVQELKEACLSEKGDYIHCRMMLAGGLACSSKRIMYFEEDNTFNVVNEIDESYQDNLTETQLSTETMIVLAIERGAFFHAKLLSWF